MVKLIDTDDTGISKNQKRRKTPPGNEDSSRKQNSGKSGSADVEEILPNRGISKIQPFVEPQIYMQGKGMLEKFLVEHDALLEDPEPGVSHNPPKQANRNSLKSEAKQSGKSDKPDRKFINHPHILPEIARNRADSQKTKERRRSENKEKGRNNTVDNDKRRNSVYYGFYDQGKNSVDHEKERRNSLDNEKGRRNSLDNEKERRNSLDNEKRGRNSLDNEQEKRPGNLRPEARNIEPELIAEVLRKENKNSLKKSADGRRTSAAPPSPPTFETPEQDGKKAKNEAPAMLEVVKMALSRKRVTIVVDQPPKAKKRVRNSAKAVLVKKRTSKTALIPVEKIKVEKIKASEDDDESVEVAPENDEEDADEYEVGPQPPPYWEEMIADNKSMIRRLKHVSDIGEAVDHNPDLLTYMFKHPTFGNQIIEQRSVAQNVIQHPNDFREIAHKENLKRKDHLRPEHHHTGHRIVFLGHKYHINDVHVHFEDRADMISRSEISLERDQVTYDDNRNHSLKALRGVERIYLKHDEIVYEGFLVFCDRKMHRFFFLDVNGKIIYHIRDYQFFTNNCLRRFDYGVLDQDGKEVLRMTKRCSLTNKQKVDVYCPPGNLIGYVSQSYGIRTPSFWVKNHDDHSFIEIRSCGRNWKSYCDKHDYKFEFIIKVVATQHDMGLISTMWFEKQMETFSFEPFYGIHWNEEMTLNVKGLLLSSMLLVYLTHYNGRLDKRLYIERYKTPARPTYSVCEEDLEN